MMVLFMITVEVCQQDDAHLRNQIFNAKHLIAEARQVVVLNQWTEDGTHQVTRKDQKYIYCLCENPRWQKFAPEQKPDSLSSLSSFSFVISLERRMWGRGKREGVKEEGVGVMKDRFYWEWAARWERKWKGAKGVMGFMFPAWRTKTSITCCHLHPSTRVRYHSKIWRTIPRTTLFVLSPLFPSSSFFHFLPQFLFYKEFLNSLSLDVSCPMASCFP